MELYTAVAIEIKLTSWTSIMRAMKVFGIVLIVLSPVLAQIQVFPPGQFVSYPGGTVTFTCLSLSTLTSIQWLVNNTLFETLNFRNVTTEFTNGIGTLRFVDLPLEYNSTRIGCRAVFESGRISVSSDTTILLLQGLLSAVGSLAISAHESTIILNWTAPFTLDIAGDPDLPDITYCVDVVNSTSSSTLHSKCGINVTEFSYPLPPGSDCNIYDFTLTPINQAGNGTRSTDSYLGFEKPHRVIDVVQRTNSKEYFTYSLTMSAPVCHGELTFLDLNTGDSMTIDATIEEYNITFTTEQLTVNRLYNITVTASNVAGSATSYITISTHDIVNISITDRNGIIEITTVYFPHSNAMGALFNFVFIDDNGILDLTQSALLALDRNAYTLHFNFFPGQYAIFVYDVEYDGALSGGVSFPAAFTYELLTGGNSQNVSFQPRFSLIEGCNITTSLGLIRAECIYASNTIATGFHVIVQPGLLSEVGKIYTNQTRDRQTPVTVLVEESGTYQVTIFAIRNETGIVGSNVEYQCIKQVSVNTIPDTTTTSGVNESASIFTSEIPVITIGTGSAIGILSCINIILCGIIIAQYCKIKSIKQKSISANKMSVKFKVDTCMPIEELNPANDEIQLYEEIGATQNVGASSSVPVSVTTATTCPQYEDIVPAGLATPKSGGDYQITLCAAYGVPLNAN